MENPQAKFDNASRRKGESQQSPRGRGGEGKSKRGACHRSGRRCTRGKTSAQKNRSRWYRRSAGGYVYRQRPHVSASCSRNAGRGEGIPNARKEPRRKKKPPNPQPQPQHTSIFTTTMEKSREVNSGRRSHIIIRKDRSQASSARGTSLP